MQTELQIFSSPCSVGLYAWDRLPAPPCALLKNAKSPRWRGLDSALGPYCRRPGFFLRSEWTLFLLGSLQTRPEWHEESPCPRFREARFELFACDWPGGVEGLGLTECIRNIEAHDIS